MPSMMITEEEFLELSKATQEELSELFRKSFLRSVGNLHENNEETAWELKYKMGQNLFKKLNILRSSKNSQTYEEYHENLLKFQAELPFFLADQVLKPTAISIEMAIGFVRGLSKDSLKVLSKLSSNPAPGSTNRVKGTATRKELEELLMSAGKINGTVGSINRRFTKRFDKRIYGERLGRLKLIEFDEVYKLTCDPASIELAIIILKKGYKIGDGDITLKFISSSNHIGEAKALEDLNIIEEKAIIFANLGRGYVRNVSWELEYENETLSFDYDVALTSPSGTIVIESISGHEWVDDDGDDIWQNAFYYGAFPDAIIFANKEFKIYLRN